MISKTSMTSTSGVVLMSDRGVSAPPASPTFIAIRFYPLKNILDRKSRAYSALSEIRGRQGHFPKQTVIGKWPLANALFLNSWLRGRSSGWFSRRGTFDRSRWTYCTVRRNVAKNIVGKTAQVFCDALVTTLQPVI